MRQWTWKSPGKALTEADEELGSQLRLSFYKRPQY